MKGSCVYIPCPNGYQLINPVMWNGTFTEYVEEINYIIGLNLTRVSVLLIQLPCLCISSLPPEIPSLLEREISV